jgi:small-conductance mechanosensitive channel
MSQKRFSKEGFQPLPENGDTQMAHPNDATIDIPLTAVNSQGQTGARKIINNPSPTLYQAATDLPLPSINEKSGQYHRGPGGRRKKMEEKGRETTVHEDGTVTGMGKLYTAVFNFSIITRYFLYVLPLALAIAVPIVIGATFAKRATIGGVRIVWFFTWVEILWISLWVSKLTAQFLPYVFQFLCGIVSAGTRKYSLILTALEIPLSLVGWALTALTTFVPLMCLNPDQRSHNDTGLKYWEGIVKDILFAAFFSTLILLAEKLLVQLISISYHRKQFDQKIKESKRSIYLLSLLYDASRNLFPAYCPEFAAEDYVINDSLDLSSSSRGPSKPGSKHGRSGSVTPMRLIQDVGRVGDKLTAAFGNVAHEITGKQVFNPTSAHSIVVEALEKNVCSEALARRLWMSFVVEGKDALYQEDIIDVLGADRALEAEECFHCLDRDGNGDISLDEMVLTVCEFGKERYSIANSMHDVDQAIDVLDTLLCTVAFIIMVFIFVAFLNKSFTTTLATAGTALLSLSFVFSVTAQEVLGSCIFLFVKHPFDVGDRVDIGDNQLVVERISLLFTVFRKVKDHKTTQVPNIVLNSQWIDNVSRSKAMREQVFLYIHSDTTLEDIQLLRNQMSAFVLDKDNSRDFQPDIDVELTGLAEMNKLELKVEIRHKSNWANEAVRASRRSKFMCALVLALRKVPIYGPGAGGAGAGDPANPTYSVAISHEMAQANKKEFAENKEKMHIAPVGVASVKSTTNLSPTVAKSSALNLGTDSRSGSSPTTASKDAAVLRSLDPKSAALADVHNRSNDELARLDTKRNNDIEEVRDILRQESVTGRRRAPTVSRSAQSSVPFVSVPIAPPPTNRPAPKVNYYEEMSEYRPATAGSMTAPPRGSSRDYGSNNPYVPPLQTGNQSEGHSRTASPVTNRLPVPGNAFSRFPVAPNNTQNGYAAQNPGQM